MKKNHHIYQHGFIGLGNMASVILESILTAKFAKPNQIIASRRSIDSLKKIKKKYRIATTSHNFEVASQCQWLWLGIKPFQAPEILKEIAPSISTQTVVVSMMAGLSVRYLKKYLGSTGTIIRIMPNTPALLGIGMTGMYCPKNISQVKKNRLLKILKTFGKVEICAKETQMDAITGLSGSGPAFIYAIAQGLIKGGQASGLSKKQAHQLAFQTLLGASKMLQDTQESPDQLIKKVVSKGGTTEAGLQILEKYQIQKAMAKAVQKASRRAAEIREEQEKCMS